MTYIITLFFLIALLMLFVLVLKSNGNDFIAPSSIVCIMTLVSLGIMSLFISRYELNLSFETVVLIIISVLSFYIGASFRQFNVTRLSVMESVCVYGNGVVGFSFIFVVIATALYFKEVKNVSALAGYSNSALHGMLYYYRNATLAGGEAIATQSKIVGQMVTASYAVSYLILIDIAKRIIYGKIGEKRSLFILECVVSLFYIVQCVLSGARTQFIYYIESFLFLICFFYTKLHRGAISVKIIKHIVIVVIIAFFAFFLLGSLTGKTGKLDFLSTLFVYLGSPIPAFNALVNKEVSFAETYRGSAVFIGPTELLSRLGFNINVQSMPAPFINLGTVQTNIYGSFGRYYSSFGIFGIIIIPLFLGLIYQNLYVKLQCRNENIEGRLALYLLFSKVVFDYCIEERFFLSILSLGTILRLGYICIFYLLFRLNITLKVGDYTI